MNRNEEIKKVIKEKYSEIAKQKSSCCTPLQSCCGNLNKTHEIGKKIGYTEEELNIVPQGANLGLGCGNPVAIASIKDGETVLDLGSGAGFDCFLAAQKVGKKGKVIGVDMTPEMIEKARENAKKSKYENIEFRLGEIENLPVADNSVDLVISNCVINLSTDKPKVFAEIFRVLKPGGRFIISDIVLLEELPDFIKNSMEAYIGCISGAVMKDEYMKIIKEAGFKNITIIHESNYSLEYFSSDLTNKIMEEESKISSRKIIELANVLISMEISGVKPYKV